MFKRYYTYKVSKHKFLNEIFTELPVNAFLNKGRCGIGATTMEILNKRRSTIITVPTRSILESKKKSHPELFIINGDTSEADIKNMLLNEAVGHKIMIIPESFGTLMKVAAELGKSKHLYDQWFLLCDESHTFISEHYRDNILKPFDYFWRFKIKSLLSATPYYFSDPRFNELDHYEIRFDDTLCTIDLVEATSVVGTMVHILLNSNEVEGNIHIYCNSVTLIDKLINGAELKDCNIFCADTKEGKNRITLGDNAKFIASSPSSDNFKKVNFYTCKYFEGWDLHDQNATIIFVTDVYHVNTLVGIESKGKQAVGRARQGVNKIIHVTNHRKINQFKPLATISDEYKKSAAIAINYHNLIVKQHKEQSLRCDLKMLPATHLYAQIDPNDKSAMMDHMRLDQLINEAANSEVYNDIDFIQNAWERANFSVKHYYSHQAIETTYKMKRRSKATQLKEDVERIQAYRAEGMLYSFGRTPIDEVRSSNPLALKAYEVLGIETLARLDYNIKQIEKELIMRENLLANQKLLKLMKSHFIVGERYARSVVKEKLQTWYNELNIRTENGKIKVAKASDLESDGLFDVEPCKMQDHKEHGIRIIRANFTLRVAA